MTSYPHHIRFSRNVSILTPLDFELDYHRRNVSHVIRMLLTFAQAYLKQIRLYDSLPPSRITQSRPNSSILTFRGAVEQSRWVALGRIILLWQRTRRWQRRTIRRRRRACWPHERSDRSMPLRQYAATLAWSYCPKTGSARRKWWQPSAIA